jgi:hypothetical protein
VSISLLDVSEAASTRDASLAGEIAGYLILAAADQVAEAPRTVSLQDLLLEADGRLRVAGGMACSVSDAERMLRQLLEELLLVACSVTPALLRTARRVPAGGIAGLIRELETALIPVNRPAARRAMARLHREASRARRDGNGTPSEARAQRPAPAKVALRAPSDRAASLPDPTPCTNPTPPVVNSSSPPPSTVIRSHGDVDALRATSPAPPVSFVPEALQLPEQDELTFDDREVVTRPEPVLVRSLDPVANVETAPPCARIITLPSQAEPAPSRDRMGTPLPAQRPNDQPIHAGARETAAVVTHALTPEPRFSILLDAESAHSPADRAWFDVAPIDAFEFWVAADPNAAEASHFDSDELVQRVAPTPAYREPAARPAFMLPTVSAYTGPAAAPAPPEREPLTAGHERTPALGSLGVVELPDASGTPVSAAAVEQGTPPPSDSGVGAPLTPLPVRCVAAVDDAAEPLLPPHQSLPADPEEALTNGFWPPSDANGPELATVAPTAGSLAFATARFAPERSDVSELVASFRVAEEQDHDELRRDLKRMVGLDPTPAPVDVTEQLLRARHAGSRG